MDRLRIGVIGSGRIASRFCKEGQKRDDVCFSAVFNPNRGSAQRFAASFSGMDAAEDLNELLERSDAVYIAAPHAAHYAYARVALLHGRHVLCEKPVTLSASQTAELFALARENACVLMEAVKTAYAPGFRRIRELCESGAIGTVLETDATFTRLTPPGVREWTDRENGGSLTELGTYLLLPPAVLLGTDWTGCRFWSVFRDGVDAYTRYFLTSDGRCASGTAGLGGKKDGSLTVAGTEGYLKVGAPWWKPVRIEVHHEDPNQVEVYEEEYEGEGFRYELDAFLRAVRGEGKPVLTEEQSVWISSVLERYLTWRKEEKR